MTNNNEKYKDCLTLADMLAVDIAEAKKNKTTKEITFETEHFVFTINKYNAWYCKFKHQSTEDIENVVSNSKNFLIIQELLIKIKELMSNEIIIEKVCILTQFLCSENPNCYYKQLQLEKQDHKNKVEILEEIIKVLNPNSTNDELYNIAFNGEYLQQIKDLKQNNEELEKELKSTFEEKDKLNVIIDRLLSHSGYNKETASAEDFEDVYQDMDFKQGKHKEYKQALADIKEIAYRQSVAWDNNDFLLIDNLTDQIRDKIQEVCGG